MRINKLHNLAVTVSFVAALMVSGGALAAPSMFTAETDQDNNGYNGTVKAGGDGYAFTAEDSARYYKFLYLYDFRGKGEVCRRPCRAWGADCKH